METYFYEIAGLRLALEADFPLIDSDLTRIFRTGPLEGALRCHLRRQEEIPMPPGELVYEEELMKVLRDGDTIYRYFLTQVPDQKRYMLSTYAPGADITIAVRESELHWAAQLGYIWLGLGLNHLLLKHGRLVLHSAGVETDRGAILFTAKSGTGKSTQAELWRANRGTPVLNGDRCGLGFLEGVPCAFGLPMAGTSGITQNKVLPLRALVALVQAPENSVRRLGGAEALLRVGFGSVMDRWRPQDMQGAMDMMSRILEKVPAFELRCRPDAGAVEALERALEEL